MIYDIPNFMFILETVMFCTVILMHLTKKSSTTTLLYLFQSLVVLVILGKPLANEWTWLAFLSLVVIFSIKIVLAPYFFLDLIKKHQLKFSVSTYLNVPMTLIVLAALTILMYSETFKPLVALGQHNENALSLALAMMLISIFLIINRKGALSQMLGILSLENAIVSFASLSRLEQSPALQIGIMFDIFVWILIASVFVSMIYRKFGALNVTELNQLKEE